MDLQQQYADAVKQLAAKRSGLAIEVDWETGMAILASLQLALRHPGNRGGAAARVRGFCDLLLALIEADVPELARLLRMGDDPRHDQPSNKR
jgi:hypothetical protein